MIYTRLDTQIIPATSLDLISPLLYPKTVVGYAYIRLKGPIYFCTGIYWNWFYGVKAKQTDKLTFAIIILVRIK